MNAQELATLWEHLAARCPELRPVDGEWSLGAVVGHDIYFPVLLRWESASDPETHNESPLVAAALWRDAAVRFLAESGIAVNVMPLTASGWSVKVAASHKDHRGSTLDHALAAAVGAVLDSGILMPTAHKYAGT